MLKIITLLMFSALLLYPQSIAAKEVNTYNDTNYDYNFDENSFNISDEQFKEVEEVESENEKQSFTSKVVNSGHFTSNTATKTWIPFRRSIFRRHK